jgi:hypothetical protein
MRIEIQEWLNKGNKIKKLPYYGPKNEKVYFGKISSKTKKRGVNKGRMK